MFNAWRKKGNDWRCRVLTLAQGPTHGVETRLARRDAKPHDRSQKQGDSRKHWMRTVCAAAALLAGMVGAAAGDGRDGDPQDLSAGNLLVVLRETPGANKLDEGLTPFGKITARAPDGREYEFEASWFQYL